jgi:hypothetical protein
VYAGAGQGCLHILKANQTTSFQTWKPDKLKLVVEEYISSASSSFDKSKSKLKLKSFQ